MNIDKPLIDHGKIESTALYDLPNLAKQFATDEDKAVRMQLAPKRAGNSFFLQTQRPSFFPNTVLRYRAAVMQSRVLHVYRFLGRGVIWSILEADVLPVVFQYYPHAALASAQVTMLPAGEQINRHSDAGLIQHFHRLHIPLVTDQNVIFEINGANFNLAPGRLYELNNVMLHAVYNRSSIDRYHLILDLLPCEIAEVVVHDDKESFREAVLAMIE